MAFPKLKLTVAPSVDPVSLAEVKAHLRVDSDDDDALIAIYIGAVVGMLDGPEGLGSCLSPQTWRQEVVFGACPIRLPLGPVNSITGFVYLDDAGAQVAIDVGDYTFTEAQGADEAQIELDNPGALSGRTGYVTYTAGFAETPRNLKAAIMLWVGDLYRVREANLRDELKPNPTVDNLLRPFKRNRLDA